MLILSRADAIRYLHTVTVAPITSTIHGVPSEVVLDVAQGMKGPCAANLDHIQTVSKSSLERHVSSLSPQLMEAVCRALAIAVGCS